MQPKFQKKQTVTLIEFVSVLLIIAVLAGITATMVKPIETFTVTRNATRLSDINQIINAITQYTADPSNSLKDFGTIPMCTQKNIAIGKALGNINLEDQLVPDYIKAIPSDPQIGNANDTGYHICLVGERIVISAPYAEGGTVLEVRR